MLRWFALVLSACIAFAVWPSDAISVLGPMICESDARHDARGMSDDESSQGDEGDDDSFDSDDDVARAVRYVADFPAHTPHDVAIDFAQAVFWTSADGPPLVFRSPILRPPIRLLRAQIS